MDYKFKKEFPVEHIKKYEDELRESIKVYGNNTTLSDDELVKHACKTQMETVFMNDMYLDLLSKYKNLKHTSKVGAMDTYVLLPDVHIGNPYDCLVINYNQSKLNMQCSYVSVRLCKIAYALKFNNKDKLKLGHITNPNKSSLDLLECLKNNNILTYQLDGKNIKDMVTFNFGDVLSIDGSINTLITIETILGINQIQKGYVTYYKIMYDPKTNTFESIESTVLSIQTIDKIADYVDELSKKQDIKVDLSASQILEQQILAKKKELIQLEQELSKLKSKKS